MAPIMPTGNPAAHVVLRGGVQGTNYDAKNVAEAVIAEAKERKAAAS